jgi:hypothetical protein
MSWINTRKRGIETNPNLEGIYKEKSVKIFKVTKIFAQKELMAVLSVNDLLLFGCRNDLSFKNASMFMFAAFTQESQKFIVQNIRATNYLASMFGLSNQSTPIELFGRRLALELFGFQRVFGIQLKNSQRMITDKLTSMANYLDVSNDDEYYDIIFITNDQIGMAESQNHNAMLEVLEKQRQFFNKLKTLNIMKYKYEFLSEEVISQYNEPSKVAYAIGRGPFQKSSTSIFSYLLKTTIDDSNIRHLERLFSILGSRFGTFCVDVASAISEKDLKVLSFDPKVQKQHHMNIADQILAILKERHGLDSMTLQLMSKQFSSLFNDINYKLSLEQNSQLSLPIVNSIESIKFSNLFNCTLEAFAKTAHEIEIECTDFIPKPVSILSYMANLSLLVHEYCMLNDRNESNQQPPYESSISSFIDSFESGIQKLFNENSFVEEGCDTIKIGEMINLMERLFLVLTSVPVCDCRKYSKFVSLFKISDIQCPLCSEVKEHVLAVMNFKFVTLFERRYKNQNNKENQPEKIFIPKRRYYQEASSAQEHFKAQDKKMIESLMKNPIIERITCQIGFMKRETLDKVEEKWLDKRDTQFKVLEEEQKIDKKGIFVENFTRENLLKTINIDTNRRK